MEPRRFHLNAWEHCPECGALLVPVTGGAICPHCNFECEYPEERRLHALAGRPGYAGEGARFHLLDDASLESFGEAA